MKSILSILLMISATQVVAANSIDCFQAGTYGNEVGILVDLDRSEYQITFDRLSRRTQVLGSGQALVTREERGHLEVTLVENGRPVGYLKAVNAGPSTRKSYLNYKGQIVGGDYPAKLFVCHID